MNLARRSAAAAAAEVLAETISETGPGSPRYQAGLRSDMTNDGRSIAGTDFTFTIFAPTNRDR
jgi:hypothetical protein